MKLIPEAGLPRAAMALALAAIPAGGTYAALEQIPAVEQDEKGPGIAACAQELGKHATRVATLPGACEPFQTSFVLNGMTVYVTEPPKDGPGSSADIHSEYKLPAADDFPELAEGWNDDQEAQFDKGVAYLAATLELGGTLGLFLAMRATIRERRGEREPNGPTAVTA